MNGNAEKEFADSFFYRACLFAASSFHKKTLFSMAKFFTEYFHNICKASRQRLQRHYVHLILLLLYIPFHDIATSNSMSSVRILLVVFFIKVNLTTSYVCEGVNSQNIINHIINFIDWSLRSAYFSGHQEATDMNYNESERQQVGIVRRKNSTKHLNMTKER